MLGIVQSIFVQLAVNHGLGKKQDIVSDSDFVLYEKVLQHPDKPNSPRPQLLTKHPVRICGPNPPPGDNTMR
jgi:hypothetical protein